MGLEKLSAKALKIIAEELGVLKRNYKKKEQLVILIEEALNDKRVIDKRHNRSRKVRVTKNGKEIALIDGVINTFLWAEQNKICNQGWVRRSLKNHEATKPGFKFKDAGYLFEYAD